jgi:hypothetical protein
VRRISTFAVTAVTALAAGGGVAHAMLADSAPTSSSASVTEVDGNPTCSTLLPAGSFAGEYKREPATSVTTSLTHAGKTGQLSLVVRSTPLGQVADFTMTGGLHVVAVLIKASDGGLFYDYRPAGSAADTGLHGPLAPSGDVYHDISHISVCVKPKPEPPKEEPPKEEPPKEEPPKEEPPKEEPPKEEPPKEEPPRQDPPRQDPPVTTSVTPPAPPAPVAVTAPSATRPAAPRTPARVVRGAARLQAPDGCRSTTFRVRVSGRQIRRVTVSLDGRPLRTFTRARSSYAVRIDPRKLGAGVHRIAVRVTFTTQSGTRSRTLRSVFQRCLQVAPRFTG